MDSETLRRRQMSKDWQLGWLRKQGRIESNKFKWKGLYEPSLRSTGLKSFLLETIFRASTFLGAVEVRVRQFIDYLDLLWLRLYHFEVSA